MRLAFSVIGLLLVAYMVMTIGKRQAQVLAPGGSASAASSAAASMPQQLPQQLQQDIQKALEQGAQRASEATR